MAHQRVTIEMEIGMDRGKGCLIAGERGKDILIRLVACSGFDGSAPRTREMVTRSELCTVQVMFQGLSSLSTSKILGEVTLNSCAEVGLMRAARR